jgi:hypothetical protein
MLVKQQVLQAPTLNAIMSPTEWRLSEPFALKKQPGASADRVSLETVTPPMFGKES